MPPENGISMAYSSGSLETYLDKKAAVTMSVVLNGKHDNQQTVLDTLGKIHTYLNMRKTYPQTNNFQIANILTTSPPSYLGREENRQWLYGSSLAVRFYLKGD
nr:MAG TPA: Minor capsid protein from bacteriophage [Caudoviricetes sp.]